MTDRTDVFLALEPLLVARLQTFLDPAITVLAARSLAGVAEQAQIAPAVQIYAGGYRPLQEQAQGRVQRIEQTWTAVVVVRNAKDQLAGSAARADASPICDAVLTALLGWIPGKQYTGLQLAPAPAPQWSPGGFGYYPLSFTTSFTVRSSDVRTS